MLLTLLESAATPVPAAGTLRAFARLTLDGTDAVGAAELFAVVASAAFSMAGATLVCGGSVEGAALLALEAIGVRRVRGRPFDRGPAPGPAARELRRAA